LYGRNAQGKTNVVEGIYYFSRGRSFRGREDKELVRFGTEGFRIYLEFEDKCGRESLEYALFGRERLRKKNDYKISKITEMIGSFKAVLFYPDDLSLVKDGPEERRGFLNVAAANCYPLYIKYYSDYKKALENRNCILKMMQKGLYVDKNELDSWSASMAEYASYIYLFRKDYVERLKKYAGVLLKEITDGKEELSLSYESQIPDGLTDRGEIKAEYERIFSLSLEREIAAGVTLFGPHRDDIDININGKSARSFASQGQQRSIVLALKLSEGEVIKEICGEYPVFLFDDVLSELDPKRRAYLLGEIHGKQVIMTGCDDSSTGDANVIYVKNGTYTKR
jgi:DNA replication and repair protein RecF